MSSAVRSNHGYLPRAVENKLRFMGSGCGTFDREVASDR